MGTRGALIAMAAVACFASEAAACPSCTASSLCCVPGFAFMGAYVGIVLPILAAFIERPFFTLAGVRENALYYSIGTNLVSAISLTLVGVFGLGLVWAGGESLELLWITVAIGLSTAIEHFWINRCVDGRIRLSWLLLGNIISALLIMSLPFVRHLLGPVDYSFQKWIWRNTGGIAIITLLACGGTYLYAVCKTGIGRRRRRDSRGFEVLPVAPPAPASAVVPPDA